jgi:pyruvate ferredoxin oxidoreductase gamma subunit
MKEIRIHGRGGQGSLVLAQLLAIAAFKDGKYCQAFPFLGGGGDRKGKPIQAFCRLDDKPIRLRSRVHHPDYVIVQDVTILGEVDVVSGIKETGIILVNTERALSRINVESDAKVLVVPASRIAQEILGRPIGNTALLGAFAAATGELTVEAASEAVKERLGGRLGEKNALVVQRSYQTVKGKG